MNDDEKEQRKQVGLSIEIPEWEGEYIESKEHDYGSITPTTVKGSRNSILPFKILSTSIDHNVSVNIHKYEYAKNSVLHYSFPKDITLDSHINIAQLVVEAMGTIFSYSLNSTDDKEETEESIEEDKKEVEYHPLEKALFKKAATYLLNSPDVQTVLVDIFERDLKNKKIKVPSDSITLVPYSDNVPMEKNKIYIAIPEGQNEAFSCKIVSTDGKSVNEDTIKTSELTDFSAEIPLTFDQIQKFKSNILEILALGGHIDIRPSMHTVVLYKKLLENGKHDIIVIDPSNFKFSKDLSKLGETLQHDALNKIDIPDNKTQIYKKPQDKEPGPNYDQYRDCIDIAVKLAFGFNVKEIGQGTVKNYGVVKEISNQKDIDKDIIEDKLPVRIKQASNQEIRGAFYKMEGVLKTNLDIGSKLFGTEWEASIKTELTGILRTPPEGNACIDSHYKLVLNNLLGLNGRCVTKMSDMLTDLIGQIVIPEEEGSSN